MIFWIINDLRFVKVRINYIFSYNCSYFFYNYNYYFFDIYTFGYLYIV